MPDSVLLLALFFFVLPIIVVALSDIDKMSNGRYATIVVGSWVTALGTVTFYITGQ